MYKIIKYAFLLCFLFDYPCYADHFRILEQRPLPNQLGIFFHSQVSKSVDSKIDFYVVKLNNNHQAKFYMQPVSSQSEAK